MTVAKDDTTIGRAMPTDAEQDATGMQVPERIDGGHDAARMSQSMCSIGRLRRGDIGCVCLLDADPSACRRLAEMGLVRGAMVRMICPGNACILGIEGARLSLGYSLQGNVKVTRMESQVYE
ncbi:MAG: ferrous iron transport protein A [Planctomycetes bacterium]|nr:ferrous iron transport protein A [Planctomycetota bacterium]